MPDFHSRMINIQIDEGRRTSADNFAQGHKEAQHAAAEIALEADREIERLQRALKAALEKLDSSSFSNAEHSQAKDILRKALDETPNDGS